MLMLMSLMPARQTPKCIPLDLSTISARSFPRKRESKGRVLRPRLVALGPRFRAVERLRLVAEDCGTLSSDRRGSHRSAAHITMRRRPWYGAVEHLHRATL